MLINLYEWCPSAPVKILDGDCQKINMTVSGKLTLYWSFSEFLNFCDFRRKFFSALLLLRTLYHKRSRHYHSKNTTGPLESLFVIFIEAGDQIVPLTEYVQARETYHGKLQIISLPCRDLWNINGAPSGDSSIQKSMLVLKTDMLRVKRSVSCRHSSHYITRTRVQFPEDYQKLLEAKLNLNKCGPHWSLLENRGTTGLMGGIFRDGAWKLSDAIVWDRFEKLLKFS